MKYKVGDMVRVRKDLEPGNFYGRAYYSSDMNKFKAMECVVTNIYDGTYNINNSEYGFSDEMLEPVNDLLEYALEKLGMTKEELENNLKVKVLLAKSLFQNPDILLLDEPTNNLDIKAINWLSEFIINYPAS